MSKTPADRVAQLRDTLERANRAYYVDAAPIMSDAEFDRLLKELGEIEASHPELDDPASPTKRVGGEPIEGFKTVAHAVPMLSIDNTYSASEVGEWWERVRRGIADAATGAGGARSKGGRSPMNLFGEAREGSSAGEGGKALRCCCDPKIDGVAISLRYEHGTLVGAVTRGDGVRGDDVTHAVRTIRAVPLRLGEGAASKGVKTDAGSRAGGEGVLIPEVLEIRGEIYFPLGEFERVNREREEADEEPFMNPRNAAAGTLKNLDPRIAASRKLGFVAHGRGEVSSETFARSHSEFLAQVRRLGVPTPTKAVVVDSLDAVLRVIDEFDRERHSMAYATDGMVVRVDDFALQGALGFTSKSPRWVIAYKYPAERKKTRLLRVAHQVGKTGKITPRATMEPVLLAGTTVQNATLHNYGRIRDAASEDPDTRTDIRIGDTILVEKAGEIIPYVAGVVLAERPRGARAIEPPAACPECGGPVEIEPPEAREDPALETQRRCINPQCPAQIREKLIWFAGRKQMDIDGLGEKTIDQIRATAGDGPRAIPLNTFGDIFRLVKYRDRLIELDRMGEKKVDNLLAGIEGAKSRGLAKLLAGMGIRYVGDSTARLLARQFPDIDALLAASEPELRPKAMTREEAAKYGVAADPKERPSTELGVTTAPVVHAFLHSPAARAMFRELRELGVDLASKEYTKPGGAGSPKRAAADNVFSGKTVVITGTLERYEREALKEILESLGAKVSGSVSSKTGLLIVGAEAGSKLEKARELGVRIMEESELLRELSRAGVTTPEA
ncbi:MAG: NAD-dependent DNA ligase LigA [Phycisphaerales bacterium]